MSFIQNDHEKLLHNSTSLHGAAKLKAVPGPYGPHHDHHHHHHHHHHHGRIIMVISVIIIIIVIIIFTLYPSLSAVDMV